MKRGYEDYEDNSKRGRYSSSFSSGHSHYGADPSVAAVGGGYGYDAYHQYAAQDALGYGGGYAGFGGGAWLSYGAPAAYGAYDPSAAAAAAALYGGAYHLGDSMLMATGVHHPAALPHHHSAPPAAQHHHSNHSSQPNRTVYLGGLAPETSLEEVCSAVQGGALENVKLFPDRNCAFVSFLEASAAMGFHQQSATTPPVIHGRSIKVGWGKSSSLPSDVFQAVQSGASRALCITNIQGSMTASTIQEELKKYGVIESVDFVSGAASAVVHFASIKAAIQAAAALPTEQLWSSFKYNFGTDRCSGGGSALNQQNASTHQVANQNWAAGPSGTQSPNYRTVYLGNLPRTVTADILFDTIRGGLIDEMKLIVEKCCAFVTFVTAEAAQSFFSDAQSNRIVVGGREVKVGWGKPSGVTTEISEAVAAGASRVMYLGGIDASVTDEQLRTNFQKYGTIESTRLIPANNAAFINFMSISSCLKALLACVLDPMSENYTLGFGKDRCAQAPSTAGFPDHSTEFTPYTLHPPTYTTPNDSSEPPKKSDEDEKTSNGKEEDALQKETEESSAPEASNNQQSDSQ